MLSSIRFPKSFLTLNLLYEHIRKMSQLSQFSNLVWLKGDWCYPSNSKETDSLLKQCTELPTEPESPSTEDEKNRLVEEVVKRSQKFPVPFPVENVRLHKLKELFPDEDQAKNIESTYPIIHERVLLLMASFIIYMREFGTPIEKAMYVEMTIPQLVDRLLLKRAVTFCGPRDHYKLLTGEEGYDGWEAIGTANERPPLTLSSCLSYSEQRLSAMLFVSGHTLFINNGSRKNEAVLQDDREERGVIMGLIGPRLQRQFRMEYEDMLITEQQNRLERGYGEEVSPRTCLDMFRTSYVHDASAERCAWRQIWSEFFQVQSYTYEEISQKVQEPMKRPAYAERFVPRPKANNTDIFDNEVYYKRLSIAFDCALLEANARGEAERKMAYLHVVGIGLGVWKVSAHQTDVFVLSLLHRLRHYLSKGLLNSLAHVNFAWIKPSDEIKDIFVTSPLIAHDKHPRGGVRIEQSDREPSSRLRDESAGDLLVCTYAWDGNALPGNEFWFGSLSSSGDPAAACSSQVSELHNAHINTRLTARRLRVAGQHGLRSLPDYCRALLAHR